MRHHFTLPKPGEYPAAERLDAVDRGMSTMLGICYGRLRSEGASADDVKAALDDLERALSSQGLLVESGEA